MRGFVAVLVCMLKVSVEWSQKAVQWLSQCYQRLSFNFGVPVTSGSKCVGAQKRDIM